MVIELLGEENLDGEVKKVQEEIMNKGPNQPKGNKGIFTSDDYNLKVNLVRGIRDSDEMILKILGS